MSICRTWRVKLLVVSLALSGGWAAAQTPEEYQQRRQAVRAKMEPQSVLVLRGARSSGEGLFRQENNLYYLTGINEPNVALVLYPDRPTAQAGTVAAAMPPQVAPARAGEILFVPVPPAAAQQGGRFAAAATEPQRLDRPGFAAVRPASEFQAFFEDLLTAPGLAVLYMEHERSRGLSAPMTADEQWFKLARDRGATFTVKSVTPLIAPLRAVKSEDEIAMIRTAAAITAEAQKEAARVARPGLYEYQLQAVIEHVFLVNGARRPGFATIVGSGPNSCILHWSQNTRQMQAGDLVVVDIGAEHDMYTADITRTLPVSGQFTDRQRAIYDIVLQANEAAITMVGPGVKMSDINQKVNETLTAGLVKLGLIKDQSELRRYYIHGLSHPIGLQVHDVGAVGQGALQPGMIITIEPGLYLRDEGLGVRIEDDVLVTESGHEVISAAAPKTAAEIEGLMRQPGLDFSRYLIKKH